MSVELVTGRKGEAHVTSDDIGAFNACLFGADDYVISHSGAGLKASMTSANNCQLTCDGGFLINGRFVRFDGTENVTIENGTQGKYRIDRIVLTYVKNPETGTENAFLEVLKGTPVDSVSQVNAPSYAKTSIIRGNHKRQMALFDINLSGISVGTPTKMYKTLSNLQSCFQSVSEGKQKLATSLTNKGKSTASNATFDTMAKNIDSLVLGSGTAQKPDVLAGKTFTNNDGVEYTGEMPNRGAYSAQIGVNGSCVIPAGYHNGKGVISQNIANYAGQTVGARAVSKDGSNTYFALPANAYYDSNSIVYTSNTNIGLKCELIATIGEGTYAQTATITLEKGKQYIISGMNERDRSSTFNFSDPTYAAEGTTIRAANIASGNTAGLIVYTYLNPNATTTVTITTNYTVVRVHKISI